MDAVDRPLGSTEHIYWLLDRLYCLNFVVYAELDGALPQRALGAAQLLALNDEFGARAPRTLALNLLYDRNTLPAARAQTIGRRLVAHLEAAAR